MKLNRMDKILLRAGGRAALYAVGAGIVLYILVGLLNGFGGSWQWGSFFTAVPFGVAAYIVLVFVFVRKTSVKDPNNVAGWGLITSVVLWFVVNTLISIILSPIATPLSSNQALSYIPVIISLAVSLVAVSTGPMLAHKFFSK